MSRWITSYIMTERVKNRRVNAGLPMVCNAEFCKKEVKVGDKVVAKCSKRTKVIYHEECYKKVMEGVA